MSKGYCPLESELCLRLFFILLMFSETGREGGVEGEGLRRRGWGKGWSLSDARDEETRERSSDYGNHFGHGCRRCAAVSGAASQIGLVI